MRLTKYTELLHRLLAEEPEGGSEGAPAASDTQDTTESAPAEPAEQSGSESDGAAGDPAAEPEGDDDSAVDFAKLELPDGVELDQAVVERFEPLMKGMTQDEAQKFATAFAEFRQGEAQDRIEAFEQQKQDWYSASSNDKEFGGDKFDESTKLAVQAIEKFGTPELRQFMDDYGAGNHPEVIRFMVRVGRAISEDNPGGGANNTATPKDHASILYPEN